MGLFGRQEGEQWALQLAAVACLSIASKVEEGTLPADVANLQVCLRAFSQPVSSASMSSVRALELLVLAMLLAHTSPLAVSAHRCW